MLRFNNNFNLVIGLMVFWTIGHADNPTIEPWIHTNDLYKINMGITTNEIKQKFGDPVFIESAYDSDEDQVITKYNYNFRTKEYDSESLKKNNVSNLSHSWGRTTSIEFIFVNDKLISWEEDKLTLSIA